MDHRLAKNFGPDSGLFMSVSLDKLDHFDQSLSVHWQNGCNNKEKGIKITSSICCSETILHSIFSYCGFRFVLK